MCIYCYTFAFVFELQIIHCEHSITFSQPYSYLSLLRYSFSMVKEVNPLYAQWIYLINETLQLTSMLRLHLSILNGKSYSACVEQKLLKERCMRQKYNYTFVIIHCDTTDNQNHLDSQYWIINVWLTKHNRQLDVQKIL